MRKKQLIYLFVGFCFLGLFGCDDEVGDNQKIVSEKDWLSANPTPTVVNAREQNAKHKVLVAAIDSGVDYNNPYLAEHMHYELGAKGNPIRLGWDYIGNDRWPSPYLVRTSTYDPRLPNADRRDAKLREEAVAKLLDYAPDLQSFLNARRNIEEEYSTGSYHGTHVAGLMTYDRPEIGFIAYRVLPHNVIKGDFNGMSEDYFPDFERRLFAALEKAALDKVQVVNLSLGFGEVKPLSGADPKSYDKIKGILDRLTTFIQSHPETVYVIAAGNEGTWSDGKQRLDLPCNVNASNLICVGALDLNGDVASFSNIGLSNLDFVFALGEAVISTLPSQMCVNEGLDFFNDRNGIFKNALKDTVSTLKENCKKLGLGPLSGTSMASPLVAHVAAEILIDQTRLTGAQVVQEIMNRTEQGFVGQLPIRKLTIRKPSWYSKDNNHHLKTVGSESTDTWELFVPNVK